MCLPSEIEHQNGIVAVFVATEGNSRIHFDKDCSLKRL